MAHGRNAHNEAQTWMTLPLFPPPPPPSFPLPPSPSSPPSPSPPPPSPPSPLPPSWPGAGFPSSRRKLNSAGRARASKIQLAGVSVNLGLGSFRSLATVRFLTLQSASLNCGLTDRPELHHRRPAAQQRDDDARATAGFKRREVTRCAFTTRALFGSPSRTVPTHAHRC